MADTDLDAIRARRMAELGKEYGNKDGANNAEMQEEKARQASEIKNSILSQVLNQSARARLNTIAVAKPEKAQMVENMLIQMATMGQLPSKLSEEHLIKLLEQVSERTQRKTTVTFDRRRVHMDDSDEDF